ncbi:NnrS family protein [Bowmanella dokdonensis]|uniref:NnrS family protein n=1 Tax=Bowmanella dokdonensis TaxID=751969 RepID=A0A939DKB8_9ALTE|nr:NnrS family protein [Bowmanella dokdonensis]MBN7824313.1 NnrS family protein [Bowmanella dokdonensis]
MQNDRSVHPWPVLRLGFRPLFLLGGVFALLAIAAWGGMLAGLWGFSPYGGAYWWHAHEMLFGFVAAIVVGFLLTAVQNWTGVPGVKGQQLMQLVIVWLTGRALLWFDPAWPVWLTASLDLLFLPLAAGFMAYPLIKVRQTRNLFFVPVLLLMTVANLLMHVTVLSGQPSWFGHGNGLMLMLVVTLMCVLGGRVIPMFTANGTATVKVNPWPWLERFALGGIWLLVVNALFGGLLPPMWLGSLLLATGLLHLVRWLRWRVWVTLPVPLLWSLHLAYLFIPLGLLALAGHYLLAWLPYSTAVHVLTVGAVAGMILSMMARVSLGHTGRPLKPHPMMNLAFAAVIFSALVRTAGVWLWHEQAQMLLLLSSLLWCLAFGLFVCFYWPVLTRPRVDGRPG